jgi:CYTH domain-containing protein
MGTETERKFLVNKDHPDFKEILKTDPIVISQGYLKSDETGVVRVRVAGTKGYLTVKGVSTGLTRPEFEYEIPLEDANAMLDTLCDDVLCKKRYLKDAGNGLTFEIDVFSQIDLIIAEIEVDSEHTKFEKPQWLGEDVSHDASYFNNNIIKRIRTPS